MPSTIPTDAILLVGHGTRNEQGQQQFLKLAGHLRAAVAPLPVEIAYIELQSPLINEALVSLYLRGLKTILLSPALLFAAGHAKQDVPAAIELAKPQCPDLVVHIAEPLGCHNAVLELAAIRFSSSLAPVLRGEGRLSSSSLAPVLRGEGRGEGPAPQLDSTTQPPALVLIARGTSDTSAIVHCQTFATQLAHRLGITKIFTGFIAIAQPTLPAALERAASSGASQIIVQPHLLFTGDMLETTTAAVSEVRQRHPQLVWRQADTLGADLLHANSLAANYLVQALLARTSEL